MEHFTACKGSSNFISSTQQAVSQPFLEPDNVGLETVLHWKRGNSAACHGQEQERPRHHNPEVPPGPLTAGCWGECSLRRCPQLILNLKLILQTNRFGNTEAWMKVKLSFGALRVPASPSTVGIAALASFAQQSAVSTSWTWHDQTNLQTIT